MFPIYNGQLHKPFNGTQSICLFTVEAGFLSRKQVKETHPSLKAISEPYDQSKEKV